MKPAWKPFIVGVDTSEAGASAAEFAVGTARSAGTRCYFVHVAPETWTAVAMTHMPHHVEQIKVGIATQARRSIAQTLAGRVPAELLDEVVVGFGRAPAVLGDAARDAGAELIVLGGKQHSTLGRWFGGSTCHDVIRGSELPILVTRGAPRGIRRVMAAVDLSGAARNTIEAAERYATLFGTELRVMSVMEPLPSIPELPPPPVRDYEALFEEHLKREIWPLVRYPGASTALRQGAAAACIAREAADWSADLVVVGSHGKSWIDRVLIGSVTEHLLNNLPASLLVVPIARPATAAEPARGTSRLEPLLI